MKRPLGENIGDRPLLILAVLMIILAVQMVSIGLVAEIVIRTYHESQQKPIYMVRDYLGDDDDPVAENQPADEMIH